MFQLEEKIKLKRKWTESGLISFTLKQTVIVIVFLIYNGGVYYKLDKILGHIDISTISVIFRR